MRKALILVRNDVNHDARVLREARVLRDLGYEVRIAGVVSAENPLAEDVVDGIDVSRLLGPLQPLRDLWLQRSRGPGPGPPSDGEGQRAPARGSRFRRLLVTAAFNLQGIGLSWRWSPEIVHANDFDTMWIGVAAKLLRRSRLVYDAHELWPDQDGEVGLRPWLIGCEWLFVRVADAVVTVSPGCAEAMATRYGTEPPVVVRNVPEHVVESPERARPGAPGEPLAVYVGLVAPNRGLEEAVAALAIVPGLRLRLVGRDSDGFASRLCERARTIGVIDRVELRPPVAPADVAEAIADADLGLVLIQPTSLSHRMSLPNKLFEYVAAGLPVVATDLPVLGPTVRDAGIGEVVPPGDATQTAAGLSRLLAPERNAEARRRVLSFRTSVNWGRERRILEDVYTGLARAPQQ